MSPSGTLEVRRRSPRRSSGFPDPAKSISRFLVTSSISRLPRPARRARRRRGVRAQPSSICAGHALGQRARRDVPVHHRAGARVRAVTDLDRRDEHRVRRDPRVGADHRAVLVACRRSSR